MRRRGRRGGRIKAHLDAGADHVCAQLLTHDAPRAARGRRGASWPRRSPSRAGDDGRLTGMPRTPRPLRTLRTSSRVASSPAPPTTRPPLQSVSIALDVVDTLARDARAQPQRAGPPRRRGQEHGAPDVRGARRARPAGPNFDGWLPPRAALRRVRPPGGRHARPSAIGGSPCWSSCATRSARRCRSGCRRGWTSCTSSVSRTCRRSATRRELTALAGSSLECRQGAGRVQPRHGGGAPGRRPDAEHGLHDRGARRAGRRAGQIRERGSPAASTRPSSACRRWPCRCGASTDGARRGGDLDGRADDSRDRRARGPSRRRPAAGARQLTDAIGKGEYALRRRPRA